MISKENLPRVSLDDMNLIHYEEVEIINRLLQALESEAEVPTITTIVEELLNHMQIHFDYEESLLKNRGFSMFDIHRNDHNRIMGETRMAYMNWRNFKDRESLKEFIEEDFIGWLNLHIQAMDSVAADFLTQCKES
jgi:hemerythrin